MKSRYVIGKSRYCGHVADAPGASQVHPDSILQSGEQPSPAILLPSSHSSPASSNVRPSPHVGRHSVPVHSNIGSVSQIGLQPSPAFVFPSSQASPLSSIPSPHAPLMHALPAPSGQRHPAAIVHPLHPAVVFVPSSHSSMPSSLPFPHTAVCVHDAPGTRHSQPACILQSMHPAVLFAVPSSHVSSPVTFPSPHTSFSHAPPTVGQ